MKAIFSSDLWPTIARLAKRAPRRAAAVAYSTALRSLALGPGDVLITDASDESVAAGRTSASALREAHRRGAELFSLPRLHAKVLCLGDHAVIGSMNLSSASESTLVEAAVVTDEPVLVAEAYSFVSQLKRRASAIDEGFLRRIERIPVVKTGPELVTERRRAPRVDATAPRIWLVGFKLVDDMGRQPLIEQGQREAARKSGVAAEGLSWVRVSGSSQFRREGREGDLIIQIARANARSKTAEVRYPATIWHRQDEPTCTRFFVVESAKAAPLPWRTFKATWREAGETREPSLNSTRLITRPTFERLSRAWAGERK